MALFKEITNQKGVTSRYFRISNVALNIDSKNIVITLKEYTDDTEIWGKYCGKVKVIPGESQNIKITYPKDLESLKW